MDRARTRSDGEGAAAPLGPARAEKRAAARTPPPLSVRTGRDGGGAVSPVPLAARPAPGGERAARLPPAGRPPDGARRGRRGFAGPARRPPRPGGARLLPARRPPRATHGTCGRGVVVQGMQALGLGPVLERGVTVQTGPPGSIGDSKAVGGAFEWTPNWWCPGGRGWPSCRRVLL